MTELEAEPNPVTASEEVLDDTVLHYGDTAVDALTSVLAHPRGRRRSRSTAKGATLVILAGGFKRYAADPAAEIAAIKGRTWLPQTVDFIATARAAGYGQFQADSHLSLLGPLAQHKGRIGRVVVISHGHSRGLQLSSAGAQFGISELNDPRLRAVYTSIAGKLTANATMDLVACRTSVKVAFTAKLAKTFGVPVRSFKAPIMWCVGFDEPTARITSRGAIAHWLDLRKYKGNAPDCHRPPWTKGVDPIMKHRAVTTTRP